MSDANYSMPAEWQPHAAMWLSWPHNADTWSQNLELAQAEFRQLVEAVARFETVNLLVGDFDAEKLKFDSPNVHLIPILHQRCVGSGLRSNLRQKFGRTAEIH